MTSEVKRASLTHRIALIALIATVVGGATIGSTAIYLWRRPTVELWQRVTIGLSEAEVRSVLGAPWREFHRETAPQDYYVPGYSRKKRPISAKVMIYLDRSMICYVWFNSSNRVEDIYYGPS